MILHASVVADEPSRTAPLIARLLKGEAFPWMGPGEGTWIALADAPPGMTIEVLKRGSEFHPRYGEHVETRMGEPRRHSGFHLLIETPLSEPEVLALAREAGAPAYRARHGVFDVIEFWIDDCFLLEVMTAEMADAYGRLVTPANVRAVRAAQAGLGS